MDKLNDRIRSMFDMIGTSVTSNIRNIGNQLMASGTQDSTNNRSRTSSSSSSSTSSSSSSTQSLTSASSSRLASRSRINSSSSSKETDKNQTNSNNRDNRNRRHKSQRSSQKKSKREAESVFAPRLLHSATLTTVDGTSGSSQQWIDIGAMAAARDYCAVYFIHCVKHNRIAVTKPSSRQALWMPFTPVPNNRSWDDAGLAGLLVILSGGNMELFMALKEQLPFTESKLIDIYIVQLPQTQQLVTRLVFFVKLDNNNRRFRCCQDSDSIQWLPEAEITNQANTEYLWGIELAQLAEDYRKVRVQLMDSATTTTATSQAASLPCSMNEYTLPMAFQFLPRSPHRNEEEQLLASVGLTELDVERLYHDFLCHCFPAMSMTVHSFKVYMTKYGFQYNDGKLTHYFRAFNFHRNGHITFPELLLGLACIDSHSKHNETRSKFINRYYDIYGTGYLTEDDIRLMMLDMHESEEELEQRLATVLNELGPAIEVDASTGKRRITHQQMVRAVGNHKFRGTSKLCRIKQSICRAISNAIFARAKNRDSQSNSQLASVIWPPYDGVCLGCKEKKPYLDDHLSVMSPEGYVLRREKPFQLSIQPMNPRNPRRNLSKVPATQQHKGSNTRLQTVASTMEDGIPTGAAVNPEEETVTEQARKMLNMIREFAPNRGDRTRPNGFLTDNAERLLDILQNMERVLTRQFELEPRCVPVVSPAYVIGDIHGNLADLLTLERSLWRAAPLQGVKLVFLGDMVDRGKWSVECVSYLFALKTLMPDQVTLLRGNHEVRPLQTHYSYYRECLGKYGDRIGEEIWNLTNRLFDRLPLCAVIDESIYCAHGGIPRVCPDLQKVAEIKRIIEFPEQESQVAWEILWSDPVQQQQFLDMCCFQHEDPEKTDGYIFNRKRGTAWAFNEEAVRRFLGTNGLTHMIRAHEVPSSGFFFHFDKKCATIFSCSHYCGNQNECAVILVEGDRDLMRVIRIDTTNNAPATD